MANVAADAQMAAILGPDGLSLSSRGWYDTESIAQDGGTLYVGIERVNRIVRFDFGKDGLLARGQPIDVPPGVRGLPNNKGLESLVFVPRGLPLGGTLIAISERGLTRDGNLTAFLIGGPRPGTFALRRTADYDVSDAALLLHEPISRPVSRSPAAVRGPNLDQRACSRCSRRLRRRHPIRRRSRRTCRPRWDVPGVPGNGG